MPALFATCLLLALAFALALAFSSPKTRARWKALLVLTVLLAWASLAMQLAQVVARTASTVITPGGARQPHLIESAGREALLLLGSHAAPALVVTALAWLAVRATRPAQRTA